MKRQILGLFLTMTMMSSLYAYSLQDIKNAIQSPENLNASYAKKIDDSNTRVKRAEIQKFCLRDEEDQETINEQIFNPLENTLQAYKSVKPVTNKSLTLIQENSLYKKYSQPSFSFSKNESNNLLPEKLLKGFKEIQKVRIAPYKTVSNFSSRNSNSLKMEKAVVLARYEFSGIDSQTNQRRINHGEIEFNISKEKDTWRILSLNSSFDEVLIAKRKPAFIESNVNMNKKIPVYERQEAIRRGGYGVSVLDFDEDGKQDIMIGTYKGTYLVKGNGQGSFDYKKTKFEEQTLAKTIISADFSNKKKNDLVLVRFVPNQNSNEQYSDIVYYENHGKGDYVQKNLKLFGKGKSNQAMPATAADFNNDGFLDLYVGYPGVHDFTFIESQNYGQKQGLQVHGLFENTKDKDFKDISNANLKKSQLTESVTPHAALSFDYNQDGLIDLFIVDDRGNLSPMFKNEGGFNLVENNLDTNLINHDLGMSIAGGDLDNDGHFDFALTNVNFLAAERLYKSCAVNWGYAEKKIAVDGLKIYKGNKRGALIDNTQVINLSDPGEGLAGIEFIDYNNDGLLDIFVSNGLWSGTDKSTDISSLYVRDLFGGAKPMIDKIYEEMQTSTGSLYQIALRSEWSTKDTAKKKRYSLAGFQSKKLYLNEGNDTFTEVGFLEGIDSIADGYVVASADLNNDGAMDIVFRNGDPGTSEVHYQPLQVFMNQPKFQEKGVILKLQGTKSNYNGIGAIVRAYAGTMQVRLAHLAGNNSSAQSQPIIHLGLGKLKSFTKVEVQWPSGRRQLIKNVKPGIYDVVEPLQEVSLNN